jgi:homoserine dehydrogenase
MTILAVHEPSPSLEPQTEGLRSSGTSPTVHLLGAGQVGRAFLRELAGTCVRLVAVSDSSATVFARTGLQPRSVAAHKEAGRPIADLAGAEPIPLDLAASLVHADVVVDATPSRPVSAEADLARCRAILRAGSSLALASKSALAIAADDLVQPALDGRVAFDAALGGTGARLLRELASLRGTARSVALVANASTSAILEAFEEGLHEEAAFARCRERGVLEPDPSLDLDGTDAAQKLAVVSRAVLGLDVRPVDVLREDLRSIDPALVWWRAQRGRTTRLVARASRDGSLTVACEELPRSSPLAVPSDRVAYAYELEGARLRVHVGVGIGTLGTARTLLRDVERLARRARIGGVL